MPFIVICFPTSCLFYNFFCLSFFSTRNLRLIVHLGISSPSLSINRVITLSQKPLIFKAAMESKGVFCKLTMTSLPLLLVATYAGMSAAGVTVRLLPIAKQRSLLFDSLSPLVKILESKFSPKLIMESLSFPRQLGSSQSLPVSWSCTFLAVLTRKSLIYSFLHDLQTSKFVFPWSSDKFSGRIPDFLCSPSMFWLITCFKSPSCMSFTNVMWVEVGIAFEMEAEKLTFLLTGFFLAIFSQQPGPVGRTVLYPLR